MKKKSIFICIAIFSAYLTVAQNKLEVNGGGSISGQIVSTNNSDPVAFANVVLTNTQQGTRSDETGKFVLSNLKDSTYSIRITSIGYSPFQVENIVVTGAAQVDIGTIVMEENSILLNAVTVSPGSYSIMEKVGSSGSIALSEENIKNMAWAEDVTRAVSRLPGISASDYSSRFAIRGGEANQVMISLDGMELFEPFHQRDIAGGLFSIVDVEAIRGIDLMTGGFTADYGNRLSGVFAMKTKNQKENEWNTSIGVSLMYARVYTEGKFAKNKGSYFVSARRGMLDLTLKAIGNEEYFPKFYDGLAKIEYQLNDKHVLSLHVLHSGDKAFSNNSPEGNAFEQFNSKYYSTYSWLTLKSYFTSKLSSRTIAFFSNINSQRVGGLDKYEDTDKGTFTINDGNNYTSIGLKQDWNWEATKKIHFKWGGEFKELSADYHYQNSIHELRADSSEQLYYFDQMLNINMNPKGEQFGGYLTAKFEILSHLFAETGLRYDHTTYTGDKNWSPRASLVYAFTKTTFLRAGWGHYYQTQFINSINVNNGETVFHKAALAKHYVLGFEHQLKNGISFRTEAYFKDLSNLRPTWTNLRDHLESYPEARNDNVKINYKGSLAKGIEVFLRYDRGKKISWWLSYALAQAIDDVQSIEYNGLLIKRTGKVTRLNNQTHTVYADINYRLTKGWHFNMSWQLYYGWPRTNYTYRYQTLPNGDLHFYAVHSEYNGTTYPAYHRLDLRINKTFQTKKIGDITAFLHIINLYNRKNLKKFDLDARDDQNNLSLDSNGNYVPFEDNKYWLGLLPVIGFKWDFTIK
ncbi:MAG: TonB-dependent receptor [Saprospiraceae bacterium]